jgi:hypothetical protein
MPTPTSARKCPRAHQCPRPPLHASAHAHINAHAHLCAQVPTRTTMPTPTSARKCPRAHQCPRPPLHASAHAHINAHAHLCAQVPTRTSMPTPTSARKCPRAYQCPRPPLRASAQAIMFCDRFFLAPSISALLRSSERKWHALVLSWSWLAHNHSRAISLDRIAFILCIVWRLRPLSRLVSFCEAVSLGRFVRRRFFECGLCCVWLELSQSVNNNNLLGLAVRAIRRFIS